MKSSAVVGRLYQTPDKWKAFYRHALQFLLALMLCGCHRAEQPAATSTTIWNDFSGEKAFAHVQRLVDLGPRPAGSDALEQSRAYIDKELRQAGWTVERQEFAEE